LAERWEDELDRLEADLAALEPRLDLESQLSGIPLLTDPAARRGGAGGWTPPSDLGPLPDHHADRARALEAAQARIALRLSDIRATAAHQLTALRSVPSTRQPTPVYLDVEG
jgi:hypothetical protein